MPTLSDLFGITSGTINTTPQRMRNLPPAPVKPEWDIRSGLPEPGLGQVTPEEWLPPGAGMKLAALAKGGIAPLAAGIMKNKGGATEGDPIRALAEQGITHLPESMTKSLPATSEYNLPKLREEQGFPVKEIAKTKLGRIWERMADSRVVPGDKNEYGDTVHSYRNYMHYPKGDPDFHGLTDIIIEGMKRGEIDPASVSRGNFTVEAAVRYADKIRKDMAKAKTAPDVFKEYPDTGHKWVQLNRPGQFADGSN